MIVSQRDLNKISRIFESLQGEDVVEINENAGDGRLNTGTSLAQGKLHVEPYDWKMWSSATFGKTVQRTLQNLGTGYSCEVSDMGKTVVVRMSYINTGTGKGVTKTYVLLFDSIERGDGTCFITMSKWRTFNNYSQACSYINSSFKGYVGVTSNA